MWLGPVVQSVASPIADPEVVSSILAQPHTFVQIDCEIFYTVILLLHLIQEGLLSVTSKSMCTVYWISIKFKLAKEKSVVRSTDPLNMTIYIAVDWDAKPQSKQTITPM